MGTEKRARQKANRAAKIERVEKEVAIETREVATRKWGKIAAVVGGLIAVIVLFNVLTGGNDDSVAQFEPTPVAEEGEPTPIPVVELLSEVPSDFEPFAGNGALSLVEPAARNDVYSEPPPMTIDTEAAYAAVLNTSIGTIRLKLFADEAPVTVNNFVNLAEDGFYDGVSFHRVLDNFMAQGGDPTGTGSGGPGYAFADEFDSGRTFTGKGQLAMANAGPGTNGSQFFITFAKTDWLDGLHTIFGELVETAPGDDVEDFVPVLDRIPLTGEGEPVIIESVRIITS